MLLLRTEALKELLPADAAREALTGMLREQAAGEGATPEPVAVDALGSSWLGLLDRGMIVALLDADYVTTLRTAALTAIATDLFAPAQIESLALLGSGSIAERVLTAIASVRTLPRVDVYSPNTGHCRAFAQRLGAALGLDVRPAGSAHAAMRGANLICGAYRAGPQPAIELGDLRESVHINSLSSVGPQAREVAADVWRACSCVFLDHRPGVAQSGDGQSILRDHPFDLERASELWEVVRDGLHRASDDGRTMYKSVGASAHDVALAMLAYRLAVERGAGETIAR